LKICAAGLLAGLAAGAGAQSPAGGQFQVNTTTRGFQESPQVAAAPDGAFVVVWDQSTGDYPVRGIYAQRLSPAGDLAGGELRVNDDEEFLRAAPFVAVGTGGDFAVVWSSFNGLRTDGFGRIFDSSGQARGPQLTINESVPGDKSPGGIASGPSGDFITTWTNRPQTGSQPDSEVFGQRLSGSGDRLGTGFEVNTHTAENQARGAVAVDGKGDFLVVWNSDAQDGSGFGIFGQRFAASGDRIGPEFQVNSHTENQQALPAVAGDRQGNFVVVWQSYRQDGSDYGIYAQRYAPSGERVGGEFRVNDTTASVQSHPSVSTDAAGNFVVAWDDYLDVWAKLYRADGTPVRQEVRVTSKPLGVERQPSVSLGGNGTFVVVWHDSLSDGSQYGVFGQLFSASPGGEPCVFRGGLFLCDTAHKGGEAEVEIRFGRTGDQPLLGDVDGDGRADPCVRRGRRFLCDTAHDGRFAEVKILFGLVGDSALLGDVDGDGDDDPCLWRGDTFLCDTAHDGGAAEVAVAFGAPGDTPLLGDLDGDGRADPCVRRGRDFLCDTAHDGGAAEARIRFGLAKDRGLLADVDGDGDADPCLYRAGRFLCDTAHDGSPADLVIAFGPFRGEGGDVPLLGNLDGL